MYVYVTLYEELINSTKVCFAGYMKNKGKKQVDMLHLQVD